jgi:hypothetical protein
MDAAVLNGVSEESETYGNRGLASKTDFKLQKVELWCLGKVKGDTQSIVGAKSDAPSLFGDL